MVKYRQRLERAHAILIGLVGLFGKLQFVGDYGDFSEDTGGPKKAENDPVNPEKSDRVRSAKTRPRNQ